MSQGHGIIINMSSLAPFIFTFNPTELESSKKINYAIAPNIGGAYKKRYFSGFDTKEITVTLTCLDMEAPTGVMEEIAYFEQLREPDPGITGLLTLYGNQNYPPPQVLFQFGVSFVPLVWDVIEVSIKESYFHSGMVRGVIGVPKKADITLTLALDEGHALNIANQVAKKAEMYAASAKSIAREMAAKGVGFSGVRRKEKPGIYGRAKMDVRY